MPNDDGPVRPTNSQLDIEERTQLQADPDYAVDEYDAPDYGFVDSDPDPIPVYMVEPAPWAYALVDWTSEAFNIDDSRALRVAGRVRNRKRLIVRNDGADNVYLGSTYAVSPNWSGKIQANTEQLFEHTSEVWATCASGETASLNVFSEHYVEGTYDSRV